MYKEVKGELMNMLACLTLYTKRLQVGIKGTRNVPQSSVLPYTERER